MNFVFGKLAVRTMLNSSQTRTVVQVHLFKSRVKMVGGSVAYW